MAELAQLLEEQEAELAVAQQGYSDRFSAEQNALRRQNKRQIAGITSQRGQAINTHNQAAYSDMLSRQNEAYKDIYLRTQAPYTERFNAIQAEYKQLQAEYEAAIEQLKAIPGHPAAEFINKTYSRVMAIPGQISAARDAIVGFPAAVQSKAVDAARKIQEGARAFGTGVVDAHEAARQGLLGK